MSFGPGIEENLDRARQYGLGAWEKFSQIMDGRKAHPPKPAPFKDGQYRDELGVFGLQDNVPRSLIDTESGGNWMAANSEAGHGGKPGHFGFLQFGQSRLQDAQRAGVLPANYTPEQFKQNPGAQIAVANWHFDEIDQRIKDAGFDKYVGQSIGGVPINMNAMRAIAHLGGFGGLTRFINSGGQYNPADSFGTSLKDYGQRHAQPY